MPDTTSPIILHNYPLSPFAEKARLALGLKRLAWRSVEVAPMPPRPDLTSLTGGYRRIPVMQIGADIFCDTNIILPTLDRLFPDPPLYPRGMSGVAAALSFNFERTIWLAIVGVMAHFVDDLPDAFLKDRKDDYLYVDMSKDAMEPQLVANVQVVRAQLAWLQEALDDGRRFVLGDTPGVLDLAYFHPLSLVRRSAPPAGADALLGLSPLLAWYERVEALGHGSPSEMSAEEALAAAKAATPADVSHIESYESDDPRPGAKVTVTPDDFAKVPVRGTLVAADAREIIIHRHEERAGDLHIHFPRAGFVLKAEI